MKGERYTKPSVTANQLGFGAGSALDQHSQVPAVDQRS